MGEYGLVNFNGGVSLTGVNSVQNLGYLSNHSKGQPQRGIKGYFDNETFSYSFGAFLNDKWHVALRGSKDERDFAAQNFYTTFVSDTAKERINSTWTQMQVTNLSARHKLQFDAGYKFLKDEFIFNSASPANLSKSYLLQGLITDEWKIHAVPDGITPNTVLTSGIQFVNKRINSNDRGKHNIDQVGFFTVLKKQIFMHSTISPGLRLEWNERSGIELIPQINLSYRRGQWQFRGSAGKTIRDADFTERFNNYGRALVTSGRVGNPDLVAERSVSYEAGADFFAMGNLRFSATVFKRDHKDLIDYVTTSYADMPRKDNLSPTGTYALARNISSVKTTGVETDIQFSKKIDNQQNIWATAGITWLESKSSSATPSFYISSHAKWLTNFNAIYTYRWFSIGINGLYKKRQPQTATAPAIAKVSADYFVLNGKVEAALYKNRIAVFMQADNMFDRNYADLLGSQMPGRWLMGGVKVNFGMLGVFLARRQ